MSMFRRNGTTGNIVLKILLAIYMKLHYIFFEYYLQLSFRFIFPVRVS